MPIIPFPAWRPDTPDLGSDLVTASGVVPITEEHYGPFMALATITDALTARCQGAAAFLDSSGNVHIFAGDATKLYKLLTTTWDDVSRLVGGAYAVAGEATWRFAQISLSTASRIIACGDVNTDIQSYTLGVSTDFAQLAAAAPRAKTIALMYPSFLVVGNTWDATDGYRENRVWWPDPENPASWPTPGSAAAEAAQSDFRDLAAGGPITALTGAVGGNAAGLVFSRKAVHRVVYAGPPTVLDFFPLSTEIGAPAGNSVIAVRDFAFWLSEDGFYMTDGASIRPIGSQQVDEFFYGRVDQNYMHRIYAAADPSKKLVYWAFPDSSASSGIPNNILAYNYEIGRWSLPADNNGAYQFIFKSFAQGKTLDELDPFGTLDTLAFSLDSPAWQGGRPVLAGFDSLHKYGLFNGSNLAATLDSGELALPDGRRIFVSGIRPLIDGSGTGVTALVRHRDTPYGTLTSTPATAIGSDGVCPQRIDARFARARFTISAGQSWTKFHGIEPYLRASGRR